ncbi:conserved protein, unknown function [Hepatocystis sp. ex Piliocolobus tephrosceles]|nr:conserved protein, unknown function [Hepatocystis sp. ex Piliocolobus tephrosceles]
MDNKKINMTEHQWRLFEYNMSKWMIDNKYILDSEEKKKFYKCANYSIGLGALNGSLVYFLCKKNEKYFKPMSRFFLTFSLGIYTSMFVNKIFRRKAYTEILTEKTTMTDKAKEVMNDILNINDKIKPPKDVEKKSEENINTELNKNEFNLLNNENKQVITDSKIDNTNYVPEIHDLNEAVMKELDDPERYKSYFLDDHNEDKSVSWDEIRRRNK